MKHLITILFALTWSLVSYGQGPVLGNPTVCVGLNTSLSDTTPGGTWSSSDVAIATVGTSGIVTGISAGPATITYTAGAGTALAYITVNPLPAAISGAMAVCNGSVTSLTDATGGGTWSSSNVTIASIGSATGIVSSVSIGTTAITYTLNTGCITFSIVTVNPTPAPISGPGGFCRGITTTLSDAVAGGVWSSSNSAVGTIGFTTGVITGISAGTTAISYTLPGGCNTSQVITVNASPGPISGTTYVCNGATTSLSNAVTGGVWSSSSTSIATVSSGSGIVTSISPGTTTISYTITSSCYSAVFVTVNPAPLPISGPTSICTGTSTTLSDAVSGGAWSCSGGASISSGGLVTGITAGPAVVSYTIASGCATMMTMTVNPSPGAITGSMSICAGTLTTLSNAIAGGTWSSSNTGIASIGTGSGVSAGISAGTAIISYTLATGCATSSMITVNPVPAGISGGTSVCAGATISLSDVAIGGIWTSSNPGIATVSGGGIVTGVVAGTVGISYTLSTGCLTSIIETVNPAPAAISGASALCISTTSTLSDIVPGGTWSSGSPAIVSITSSGIISGLSGGTSVISYTLPPGCYTTLVVIVNTTAPTINGIPEACVGSTTTLSDTITGGTWSSSNAAIAMVTTTTGLVTGVSAGTAIISYSLGGCIAATIATIDPIPSPITGGGFACIGGTLTLDDTSAGGIWNSSNASIASIASIGGSGGVVTGIATGSVVITYSFSTGCYTTNIVTVSSAPAISATATLMACGGQYLVTASGGTTYSWAPSAGVNCTTCGTTYINPMAATYVVTGTVGGCSGTAIVHVNNNRIYGHITLGAAVPPSLDMKVWLIAYNATDSSLTATDSMLTCVDETLPYYEFDGKPEGNYFVKAKLLSSVPGATGYVPTYGQMSLYWDSATTVTHTSLADSLHIDMIYGTVPTGTGLISGRIVSGAGRGTSGEVPATGMLVYLLDNTYGIVTYTYTDGSGAYSFSNLGYGTYIVYPEEYGYYTTPSSVVSLTFSSDTARDIDFKQHMTLGTITPFDITAVASVKGISGISMYPNPATAGVNIKWTNQMPCDAQVIITDMLGKTVYKSVININTINGQALLDINGLGKGIYMISMQATDINFSGKLLIGE